MIYWQFRSWSGLKNTDDVAIFGTIDQQYRIAKVEINRFRLLTCIVALFGNQIWRGNRILQSIGLYFFSKSGYIIYLATNKRET